MSRLIGALKKAISSFSEINRSNCFWLPASSSLVCTFGYISRYERNTSEISGCKPAELVKPILSCPVLPWLTSWTNFGIWRACSNKSCASLNKAKPASVGSIPRGWRISNCVPSSSSSFLSKRVRGGC